jgi:hypothetical protein
MLIYWIAGGSLAEPAEIISYFQCSELKEVKWQHNANIRLRFPKWDAARHPATQTRMRARDDGRALVRLQCTLQAELHWRADMNYQHLSPSDAPRNRRYRSQRFRRGRHDRGRSLLF